MGGCAWKHDRNTKGGEFSWCSKTIYMTLYMSGRVMVHAIDIAAASCT